MTQQVPLVFQYAAPYFARLAAGDTLPPVSFGSGTPDSGTYLRGDGAWTKINASDITSGTLGGSLGVTSSSSLSSFVAYNGLTPALNLWDGSTVMPSAGGRINFGGYLFATGFEGNSVVIHGDTQLGDTLAAKTVINRYATITSYEVITNSTMTGQVLVSLPAALYGSATFNIKAIDIASGKYHVTNVSVVHDNTDTHCTEFGAVAIGGQCGLFTTDFNSGEFRLVVQPTSNNSTRFNILATLIIA